MISINLYEILFQALNFLILLYLLRRYLTKPLSKFINDRQERISSRLEKAEQLEAKAAQLQEEQETLIKQAHLEAREIRRKAQDAVQVERASVIAKAKEDADRLCSDARKELDREYEAAKKKLTQDNLALAVKLAGKLIEKNLDEKEAEQLIQARTDD